MRFSNALSIASAVLMAALLSGYALSACSAGLSQFHVRVRDDVREGVMRSITFEIPSLSHSLGSISNEAGRAPRDNW